MSRHKLLKWSIALTLTSGDDKIDRCAIKEPVSAVNNQHVHIPTPTPKVSVTIQDAALQQVQIPIDHDDPSLSPVVSNAGPSHQTSRAASVASCNEDKTEAQMMEEGENDNTADESHISPADMLDGADDPHEGIVNETNINPPTLDGNQGGSVLVTSTPKLQLSAPMSILDHPFVGDAYQLYKANQATMKRYLSSSASDDKSPPVA
ncbi:unnamed protein product [Didymodactylos carnosus]|uniref:Uncharacterized protein n=1 Tax=Didymodactylos carnosus TaxID=1234261 RepID=A0A8S2QWG6_9BILA|nr:unnamed protein product [Didymodactylos carnosus]CAF4123178.1 unnamed protein product [Didymodactylos carnosus]